MYSDNFLYYFIIVITLTLFDLYSESYVYLQLFGLHLDVLTLHYILIQLDCEYANMFSKLDIDIAVFSRQLMNTNVKRRVGGPPLRALYKYSSYYYYYYYCL